MVPKTEEISARSHLLSWSELLQYRELFWMLAWRDFKVRYAQTAIGMLWAFIQPALTITILYVVFGRFAAVDTGSTHHLVFTACGLLPWTYFSYVMQNSGSSIIMAQSMVKKIYFPRIIIPLSKAVVGFIDFGLNGIILAALMIAFGVAPSANIVFLPLFIAITVVAALGIGILLSAMSIRFRDVQYTVPFILQLGLYLTPTAYPAAYATAHLPAWASALYFLNPMAGVVEGFRWCILGTPAPAGMAWISFAMVIALFLAAVMYFRRIDGKIADLV